MAQSYYSWMGTGIHLLLEDEIADNFNYVADAFQQAQKDYYANENRHWEPDAPLNLKATDEQIKSWNDVADVINKLIEINDGGLDIPSDQMTTDKLIKL